MQDRHLTCHTKGNKGELVAAAEEHEEASLVILDRTRAKSFSSPRQLDWIGDPSKCSATVQTFSSMIP